MKKPTLSQSVSNYIDRDFKESKKFRVWTFLFPLFFFFLFTVKTSFWKGFPGEKLFALTC